MTDKEILAAMKDMFTEERKLTDAKIEAAQKATDAKIEAAQKVTNTRIEAAQKVTNARIEAAQKETIQQIKVLLENGVEKQIRIIAEGHAQILARLPDAEEQGEIKARVTTLEHVVADHTQQINELRKAQ